MERSVFAGSRMEVCHGDKMNQPALARADDPIFMRRILCTRQHLRSYNPHHIAGLEQFGVWFGAQRRSRSLTLDLLAGVTGLEADFLAGIELGLEPASRILIHAEQLAAALGQPALAFINTLNRMVSHSHLQIPQ